LISGSRGRLNYIVLLLSLKLNIKSIAMKQKFFYILAIALAPMLAFSQTVQQANVPKDAEVDVSLTDMSNNPLKNEIVVFKSKANGIEFQGLSDSTGKFSLRLAEGDQYDYFVLGFKDSLQRNVLDIPALKANQFYKNAFNVDIQFQPSASFILHGCNFETGKADLDDESYPVLDELVAYLQRRSDEKVEIAGYTDNVGKAASNLVLSQNRANTVRAYLLMKGISPDRVTAVGYGMTNPIDDNTTADGRASNRRIEVKTLSTD
jgi:outer membrane protein OmpA-like peptidoglycan-associated protein